MVEKVGQNTCNHTEHPQNLQVVMRRYHIREDQVEQWCEGIAQIYRNALVRKQLSGHLDSK